MKNLIILLLFIFITTTANAQQKVNQSAPIELENIESGKIVLKSSKDHPYTYQFKVKNGKVHNLKVRDAKTGKQLKTKPVTNTELSILICLTTDQVICKEVFHIDGTTCL